MHELSVCQALLTQVVELAAARGASVVQRIVIEVGPLSGIEPHQLRTAFAVVCVGSCADGAALVIESTPVVVACLLCDAQSHTAPNRLVCGACGGYRTRIVAGDELRLRQVELRVAESQPLAAV